MSFGTAIVAIAAIIAIAEIIKSRHRSQRGITMDWLGNEVAPDHASRRGAVENAELQREVEELRERVKVLERIATDDARPLSLAKEIESLRDKD